MDKDKVVKSIVFGLLCCVCAWIVFSVVYSNYQTKQLVKTLGPPPSATPQAETEPASTQKAQGKTDNGTKQPAEPTVADDAAAWMRETKFPTKTASPWPQAHSHPDDHAHPHPHTEGEPLEVPPEFAHLDPYVVKAGYTDYNRYRASDPERAYKRLAETFRYMFGDKPEVDTLVYFVRTANRRPLTFDEVIDLNNTQISLLPPAMSENVPLLRQQIEYLEQTRAEALADGVPEEQLVIDYRFDFDDR